ncbi:hypothetical protein CBOM_07640 [Ceraceosorus bombacis]|uniref:Uncharacterized protein n=1 Tax=Ceraceosorus bombacis TaxID=401625 RepID=A0A0P1BL89_9BASI|nr:hypothetical protein CBOM_07640 [Ceraceosorus bombacis]
MHLPLASAAVNSPRGRTTIHLATPQTNHFSLLDPCVQSQCNHSLLQLFSLFASHKSFRSSIPALLTVQFLLNSTSTYYSSISPSFPRIDFYLWFHLLWTHPVLRCTDCTRPPSLSRRNRHTILEHLNVSSGDSDVCLRATQDYGKGRAS